MAGIFGGRNEKAVFVKKGEAPPPPGIRASGHPGRRADGIRADGRRRTSGIRRSRKQKEGRQKQRERTSGRAGGRASGRAGGRAGRAGGRAGRAGGRADDSKSRKPRIATFIFHWKLFPSFTIASIKYQSKNNNINL